MNLPYRKYKMNFRNLILNKGQEHLSPKQKELILSTGRILFPLSDL